LRSGQPGRSARNPQVAFAGSSGESRSGDPTLRVSLDTADVVSWTSVDDRLSAS